jgi:hypothetical protein
MFNSAYSKTYTLDDKVVKVIANFASGMIKMHYPSGIETFSIDEYTNFEGNMEDFVKSKLG